MSAAFNNSAARDMSVQPTPRMWVDSPTAGNVASWFTIAGWAIDAGASSGTGVDLVQAWGYPNPGSGQAAVFLGTAAYGGSRPDVAAAFGTQFQASGFSLTTNLAAGYYNVMVYAHSSVTASWSQAQATYLTVNAGPGGMIDAPSANASVGQPFTISGWAVDASSSSGTGVDTLHVWAYPSNGGAAVFVGVAPYGLARTDVGVAYQSSRFTPSGYTLSASGLAVGTYMLAVFPHSSVTGQFSPAMTVSVTVQ